MTARPARSGKPVSLAAEATARFIRSAASGWWFAVACGLALSVPACTGGPAPDQQLATIWQLRDQRSGTLELVAALGADQSIVRVRAAEALGALRDPVAIPALADATQDSDRFVRYAACFALGRFGRDRDCATALQAVLTADLDRAETDPNLRLVAVSALGDAAVEPNHLNSVLAQLHDDHAAVRGAASSALYRLLGDRKRGPGIALEPAVRDSSVARLLDRTDGETEAGTRWRMIHALAYIPSAAPHLEERILTTLTNELDDPAGSSATSRLFAIRGLGLRAASLPTTARDAVARSLRSSNPSLVLEAVVAAKGFSDLVPSTRSRIVGLAAEHDSAHVRAAAVEAVAVNPDVDLAVAAQAWRDTSTTVRIAALTALSQRRDAMEPGAAAIDEAMNSTEPRLRAAAARVLARDRGESDFKRLASLAGDPDVRVRTAVLDAVQHLPSPLSSPAIHLVQQLGMESDIALRETLATTVAALRDDRLLEVAREAFHDRPGPEFAEARKLLLEAIDDLWRDADSTTWLRTARADPDLVVRNEAARRLHLREPTPDSEIDSQRKASATEPARQTPPLGDDGIPLGFTQSQPRVEVRLESGASFEIALLPAVAPIHCYSFLQLVLGGDYRGRSFHRVVPNFVVQGGSARDDGFSNADWRGSTLRDELNPMPFLPGVVGMPKTADPDTGGDQFFITTVPAPHLDGRFTAFGRVTRGLAVVKSIEIGDRIAEIISYSK